jgi:hypothetical protein
MKRWGLRASSLSNVAKADAGQNTSNNNLNPNVLYMMLAVVFLFITNYTSIFIVSKS